MSSVNKVILVGKLGRDPQKPKRGRETREAMRAYLATHLGCSQKEAARALGVSTWTASMHFAAIRKEWSAAPQSTKAGRDQ